MALRKRKYRSLKKPCPQLLIEMDSSVPNDRISDHMGGTKGKDLLDLIKQGLEWCNEYNRLVHGRDIKEIILWTERQYKKYIRPMKQPPIVEFADGSSTGKLFGDHANRLYDSLTPEGKYKWENGGRWLHHGALGELLQMRGKHTGNYFLQGLGVSLMNSDIKDKPKWHDANYAKALEIVEDMNKKKK